MVPLVFAWRYARPLGALLTPLVVLLCVGAVYDRYHYVSDVSAGIALGGPLPG
jgi:membrane-associated phospholipid phosphatase